MNALTKWFAAQPRATQLLIGVGVPLVAIAAVVSSKRSTPAPVEDDDPTKAPTFVVEASTPTGPVFQGIDFLTDQFDGLQGVIGDLDGRLDELENPPAATTTPITKDDPVMWDTVWSDVVVDGQAVGQKRDEVTGKGTVATTTKTVTSK